MSAVADQFWSSCSEADKALQGVGDVRPALRKVLDFVCSMPQARLELAQCFVELLKGRGPWEVAYVCMRALRWPEVYEAATDLLHGTDDFRVRIVMHHVLNAYDSLKDEDYLY